MRPTARWFILLGVAAAMMALSEVAPFLAPLSIALAAGVLVASAADVFMLPSANQFALRRTAPATVRVGSESQAVLSVINRGARSWEVVIHDEPPLAAGHGWVNTRLVIDVGEEQRLEYPFHLSRRGEHAFGDAWLEVRGRLGLMTRIHRYTVPAFVRALMELPSARTAAPAMQRLRRARTGGRIAPLSGAGREFESLRDYVPDDDFRRIDWKASARRGKLTSREYQVERSQNVLIVLDLGRTMLASIDGRSKVDHAILAALGLAQAASMCDDRVGVCAFDEAIRVWLPPRRGRTYLTMVTHALHAVDGRRVEADYRLLVDTLKARCRTRSLIVLFTDIWDPDSSAVLREQMARLHPPHLPLCVTVSDSNVVRRAHQMPVATSHAYEMAVALSMLEERQTALKLLQARGVMVVDSPADEVSADLVNRYLDLKRRLLL